MERDHLERPEKDTAFPRATDALGADIKNSEEVLEADALRREDDRRTEIRQERAEKTNEEARRFLQENAAQLDETGSTLDAANRRLRENRADLDDLREEVDELRAGTRALARDAEETDPDR